MAGIRCADNLTREYDVDEIVLLGQENERFQELRGSKE